MDYLTAIIALSGVLMGAILSFVATIWVTSRRNKHEAALEIVKYREKWLQALRSELVDFHELTARREFVREDGNFDRVKTSEVMKKSIMVKLMLNPDDPDFRKLELAMLGKMGLISADEEKELGQHVDYGFIETSQRILKREWGVIKKELQRK